MQYKITVMKTGRLTENKYWKCVKMFLQFRTFLALSDIYRFTLYAREEFTINIFVTREIFFTVLTKTGMCKNVQVCAA